MKPTTNERLFELDNDNLTTELSEMPRKNFKGVILHTAEWPCTPEKHLAFLIDDDHHAPKSKGGRAWRGIGYHLVVEKDGTVFSTFRLVNGWSAAHTLGSFGDVIVDDSDEKRKLTDGQKYALENLKAFKGYSLNRYAVGICISGDGNTEEMTVAQRDSLKALLSAIGEVFEIEMGALFGHLHFTTEKTCPGKKILAEFPELAESMNDGIKRRVI